MICSVARRCGWVFGLAVILAGWPGAVLAQQPTVDLPQRRNLFREDSRLARESEKRARKAALEVKPSADQDVDFKAPTVEFDKEKNEIKGSGGVVVSGRGVQAQADEASLNTASKDAALSGNVLFSTAQGEIGADRATVNMESEVGAFEGADFLIEEGNYGVSCTEAKKLSDTEFDLTAPRFSTCACGDDENGTKPWSISADRAHITRNGYAHTYGSTMRIYGVPVFYLPYLVFPVKEERASGLLGGQYGFGGEDGLAIRQPIFGVIDDHTDVTIAPFLETRTRYGADVDVRKSFSRNNNVLGHFLYSNESLRDGDLRGADIDGLYDPPVNDAGEFDATDRYGAYYRQLWRSGPGAAVPSSFISDIHYVSDDLLLRELDEPLIGEAEDRYATSTVAFRASPLEFLSAELRGEYNQGLRDDDDDVLLQRLPELSVGALKSFRPFGFNPYGLKVVGRTDVLATDFVRENGYDGWRTDISPSLAVPFHVRNFVNGSVSVGMHETIYNLNDTFEPNSTVELDANQDRQVWMFGYGMNTSVERVYELEKGNWLSDLTSYGIKNHGKELVRLKHTIEPSVSYTYIPDTSQDSLPLYDSLDRIREKSLFIYGFTTRLYGRFTAPSSGAGAIPELAPEIDDLPAVDTTEPLGEPGREMTTPFGGESIAVRSGEIRELANFTLRQGYDYKEDIEDNDPDREGFSDINARVGLFPSSYYGLMFDTNFGADNGSMSSWGVQNHIKDDRGDALRFRYSFVDAQTDTDELSQLEGQVELKMTDRLKFGYYARYDESEREFTDSTVGVRLLSACNCWHLDLGYTDKLNPDKQQVTLRVTFAGLGDIAQDIGTGGRSSQ